MKNIIKSSNLVSFFSFLAFMLLFGNSYGQGFELEMSLGSYASPVTSHHSTSVTDKNDIGSSNKYSIAFSNKLSNKFYLRTEIGIHNTKSILNTTFKYFDGPNIQKGFYSGKFHHEKIYLGIYPEFRKYYTKSYYYANFGVLFSSDRKNEFISSNTIINPDSYPLGISVNTGMGFNIKSMGFRLGLGYDGFSKSKMIYTNQPYISFSHFGGSFSIFYQIKTESKE